MARANVAVAAAGEGWELHFREGVGGAAPEPPRRLRTKPPVAEEDIVVVELQHQPKGNGNKPGVDAAGNLIPYFPRRGGGLGAAAAEPPPGHAAAAPASQQQQQPYAAALQPEQQAQQAARQGGAPLPAAQAVLPAAGAAAGAASLPPASPAAMAPPLAAVVTQAGGGAPTHSGGTAAAVRSAALEEAAAAELAAVPTRKRLRKAGELTGSGGSEEGTPMPSPRPAAAEAVAAGSAGAAGGSGLPPPYEAPPLTGCPGPSSTTEDEQEEEEGDDTDAAQTQQQLDTQCALCDDGGNLLACDGPCMRSFHHGQYCNLLELPADLAAALLDTSETFRCPNCLAGVQQCFVCKREGKENVEVFKCIHASCGRHYHPKCVGAEGGQPFACKLHTCAKCGSGRDSCADKALELVPCRRCPLAYHRRCLPAEMQRARDKVEGARVWLADQDESKETWLDGVEASLMYCLRHKQDPETGQAVFTKRVVKKVGGVAQPACQQPYLLIRPDLKRAALAHYARQFRHLQSSRELLAEEARLERKRRQLAASSDSEEDVPLAQKRRRLAKASSVPSRKATQQQQQQRKQQAPKGAAAAAAAAPTQTAASAPKPVPFVRIPKRAEQQQQQQSAEVSPESSSAATEDVAAAGSVEAGEEVVQRRGAAAPAASAQPPLGKGQATEAAREAERLQDALDALVRLPSRQRRRDRLQRLLREAEDDPALTKKAFLDATRRPEPYRQPMKKMIDEGTLMALERSVKYAVEQLRAGRLREGELLSILDSAAVRMALSRYDDLLMVLAPYLHGERYSSYGRHFTSKRLLHHVAERLAVFLRSGDQVVDFSCGENYFLPYLKSMCLKNGVAITGRAYDIILAKDSTDFVLRSWFDVDTRSPGVHALEGLAPPRRLCIGLNPPFGKANQLADKFVLRAADLQPRLIFLIVPPRTVVPHGYSIVLENAQMCGGEEFYVPGSKHRSWNKEWPVLRILMRQDEHPERVHQGDRHFEVLADCTQAVNTQQAASMPAYGGAYPPQQPLPPSAYGGVYPPQQLPPHVQPYGGLQYPHGSWR